MAKEKEILRLRSLCMSQKAIMAAVHCASRKVKQVYDKADELAITYESIKDKSEIEVEEMFGNKKEVNYYYKDQIMSIFITNYLNLVLLLCFFGKNMWKNANWKINHI